MSSKRNKHRNQPSPNNLVAQAHRPLDSILPPNLPVGTVAGQVVTRTVSQSYSGPVPPPNILREYDQIVPGAAARILAQAEAQTQHRIKLEDNVTTSDIRRSYWGLGIGAVVSLVPILGGCGLVALGHDAAGAAIAGTSLASLAAVFVYGTTIRRTERRERAEIMAGQIPHEHKQSSSSPHK